MNAMISQMIFSHIADGKTIREAINAVLGEGWYEVIVDEVYAELLSK